MIRHSCRLFILMLPALFAMPAALAYAETTTAITQFGITWTFAQPTEHGRFANGDYWVIGPVQIVNINPPSANIGGRTKNGSMINPGLGMTQGYDSAMYGSYGPAYNATMNVALGISPANPRTIQPGSSLISSISIDEAGFRPQLKTAAILTVLAQAPPAGSFRPPYFGSDKTIRYNLAQLNFHRLPKLAPVVGTPALTTVADRFERPWLEHVLGWTGRYCHPQDNMPDYGRDMALAIGNGVLSLLLDYPDQQKQTLLVRMVQYGIDLHAISAGGGIWTDDGGHMHGRKLPILLAGLVLNDADMLAIGTTKPNSFQEDRQTWFVTQYDVGRPLYTADGRPREEYIQEDVGIPEWGEKHFQQPNRDGRNWDAYYRRIVGHSILAHVLTANILNLRQRWNWEPLFQYIDRYWLIEKDVYSSGGGNITTFHKNMWIAYRTTVHAPDVRVVGWQMSAAHGAAGTMVADLADDYIESRRLSAPRITVTFSDPLDPATAVAGALTLTGQSSGNLAALISDVTLDATGRYLTITFSATPVGEPCTIAITALLRDSNGQPIVGELSRRFVLRPGDVTGSGSVTNADIIAVRNLVGQPLTPENARADVNASGDITPEDMRLIRQQLP